MFAQIQYLLDRINLQFFADVEKYNAQIKWLEERRTDDNTDMVDEFISYWQESKVLSSQWHERQFLQIVGAMMEVV